MTFEKTGEEIIEMYWICKTCSWKNSGLTQSEDDSLRCTNCGKQKEDELYLAPDDIEHAPAITDERLLELANADENWTCRFCGNEERDIESRCSTCGALRADAQRKASAPTAEKADVRPPDAFSSTLPEIPLNRRRSVFRTAAGILMAGCILFLGVIVWKWLFGIHLVTATVSKTHWERIENLQQKTLEHTDDWRGNLPNGSFNESCENKIRTYTDCHPHDCRPHQVGHDCRCTGGDTYKCNGHSVRTNCVSRKNGSMKCDRGIEYDTCTHPRTCDTCYKTEYDTCYDRCPVRDDWCSANFYDWPEIKHEIRSGNNNEAFWPGLVANGPDQRLQRFEIYKVTFAYADESWELKPKTGPEFVLYPVGARYKSEYSRSGYFKPLQRLSP